MNAEGPSRKQTHAASAHKTELRRGFFWHQPNDLPALHRLLKVTLLIAPLLAFLHGCAQGAYSRDDTPATLSGPPPTEYATPAQIAEWESTLLARSDTSCSRIVWQTKGESLTDAVALYEQNYLSGDCLALEPTGTTVPGVPYGAIYIGFGGTFDGDLPPDQWTCGQNWPGHCLTYLSDTPLPLVFPSIHAKIQKQNRSENGN